MIYGIGIVNFAECTETEKKWKKLNKIEKHVILTGNCSKCYHFCEFDLPKQHRRRRHNF